MKNELLAPAHIIEMGESLTNAYGQDTALKMVNDNIKALAVSFKLVNTYSPDKETALNLAYQSDFWNQVKQTIK